jgi:thiol-disulfide isomerase/thioredoxin
MEKKFVVLITTILFFTIILTGCLNNQGSKSQANNTTRNNLAAEYDPISVPSFNLKDLNGREVSNEIFADYNLTLLNIWAVGCPNCVEELPYLQEIHEEMKERGINVVGIVAGGEPADAFDILDKQGVKYINILPDDAFFDNFIVKIAPAVPTSLLVDSSGRSLAKPIVGVKTKKEYMKLIKNSLKQVETYE